MKRSYFVDDVQLKESYKKLMKQLHPDRHTLKENDEQKRISELATEVTHGFSVLKDNHQRALHLLELSGKPMEDTISVGKRNLFSIVAKSLLHCVNMSLFHYGRGTWWVRTFCSK